MREFSRRQTRGFTPAGVTARRPQPIRWRETHDKLGYLELTAISAPARAALERYLRTQPRLGSAPLFPNLKRLEEPISKIGADHLLRRAEEIAELPKFDRGLWHPYRRA